MVVSMEGSTYNLIARIVREKETTKQVSSSNHGICFSGNACTLARRHGTSYLIVGWIRRAGLSCRLFYALFAHVTGLSFLWSQRARSDVLAHFMILNLTPGKSPTACPERPNPATSTSSLSSTKLIPPSLGTKAVIFLPFFLSWTLTHLRTAEFGCLASTPTFSTTIPAAWDAPAKGFFHLAV